VWTMPCRCGPIDGLCRFNESAAQACKERISTSASEARPLESALFSEARL
jgi:hypothetical protein